MTITNPDIPAPAGANQPVMPAFTETEPGRFEALEESFQYRPRTEETRPAARDPCRRRSWGW